LRTVPALVKFIVKIFLNYFLLKFVKLILVIEIADQERINFGY
jgi:hypothetical protein